jgi:hypothetical protein
MEKVLKNCYGNADLKKTSDKSGKAMSHKEQSEINKLQLWQKTHKVTQCSELDKLKHVTNRRSSDTMTVGTLVSKFIAALLSTPPILYASANCVALSHAFPT